MSSEANQTTSPEAVAKQAPTEQQESKPGIPKRFMPGQTVCNEKNEKGKLCNGHLKEVNTQHPSRIFLRGDDTLHRCQACGALYMGPPLGHVRDSSKQTRYVERDLAAILSAAGGTLPAYEYPTPAWRGEPKPKAVAKTAAPARPAAPSKAAAPKASADSSPAADEHRPAAEAQAATGQASAAPLSPTASTASPAAGAETVSDLATEASTELTPGAPKDERPKVEAAAPAAPTAEAKPKKGAGGFKVPPELQPKPGETFEEKVARLKAINEAAKRAAGKL
ncbi:MAG: hypothetical protein QOH49_5023 [Acidobacteriota bacterium]|jgi:hypothetical protein|nr:hypothetical protein [Acidobacteriota bacterium]